MDAIEANYTPDGNDWTITVTGRGQMLTGTAPGIIAARDRADQLVEKIAPSEKLRTVVHMLSGDAVAFTSAYLSARLAKPTEPAAEPEVPEEAVDEADTADQVDAEAPTEESPAEAAKDETRTDGAENGEPENDGAEPAEPVASETAAPEQAAAEPVATEAAAK